MMAVRALLVEVVSLFGLVLDADKTPPSAPVMPPRPLLAGRLTMYWSPDAWPGQFLHRPLHRLIERTRNWLGTYRPGRALLWGWPAPDPPDRFLSPQACRPAIRDIDGGRYDPAANPLPANLRYGMTGQVWL